MKIFQFSRDIVTFVVEINSEKFKVNKRARRIRVNQITKITDYLVLLAF
jgi:hypothetical protein